VKEKRKEEKRGDVTYRPFPTTLAPIWNKKATSAWMGEKGSMKVTYIIINALSCLRRRGEKRDN